MKTTKKLIAVFAVILCFSLCFAFAACENGTPLISDLGIVVEGGGFEEGSSLVAELVETTGEQGQEIVSLLETQNYDKQGEMRIFDIFVAKDGSEVQPNGKVKITIPAPSKAKAATLFST